MNEWHKILMKRLFFLDPPQVRVPEPIDEARRYRTRNLCLRLLLIAIGGLLYTASLPPVNCWPLVLIAMVPLVLFAIQSNWKLAALGGWIWGIAWALTAFRFLREIDPLVPWLIAPVQGLWPAVFAAALPGLWQLTVYDAQTVRAGYQARRRFLREGASLPRLAIFAVGAALWFVFLEWTRSRMLPWNELNTAFWRDLPLLQFTRYTGAYGLSFLAALFNLALVGAVSTNFRRNGLRLLLIVMLLFTILHAIGFLLIPADRKPNWFPLLIQGDLSQRRNAGLAEAQEALDVYLMLSRTAITAEPEATPVIWPESAIPVPYRSTHPISAEFRRELLRLQRESGKPFLIGAIDFDDRAFTNPQLFPGVTNSALYFDSNGKLERKYDKIHRVPFGEYIPFRKYLPKFLVERIDMNRDLTAGTDFNPVVLGNDVRAGTAICFEGVFNYVTREFARRGANVLVVLSNDAWYPTSSEPEQHLANAVMRAVETGLPMIRCGNNGGSGVVTPAGRFTQCVEVPGAEKRPELRRGRGFRKVAVPVETNPQLTFFVRHGEWFPWLAGMLSGAWFLYAGQEFRRRKLYFLQVHQAINDRDKE